MTDLIQLSLGRIAYETERKTCPTYHDGRRRPRWDDLPAEAQANRAALPIVRDCVVNAPWVARS